jgi:flagellum-specific peptidoglycan hydrolase FlgJ
VNPDRFIEWLGPVANVVCKRYNLFPSVCIAQGALESGWGKSCIGEYNLFGRKAVEGDRSMSVTTWEVIDGEEVVIQDDFKLYDSLEEAIEDYCILLTQEECYSEVPKHYPDNIEGYVEELAKYYATDPAYADKVLLTIRAANLRIWDV